MDLDVHIEYYVCVDQMLTSNYPVLVFGGKEPKIVLMIHGNPYIFIGKALTEKPKQQTMEIRPVQAIHINE